MAHNGPESNNSFGRSTRDLEGLFSDVRRRTVPGLFNDVDRAYRAKFLKAQDLSKRDLSYHFFDLWDNPEFRKARLNPLRRIWQAPGEAFERALRPALGYKNAFCTKWLLSKGMWAVAAVWWTSYYFMYNKGDWTRQGGWRVLVSKPMTPPTNPNFPKPDPKWERHSPDEYYSRGFKTDAKAELLAPSMPVTW